MSANNCISVDVEEISRYLTIPNIGQLKPGQKTKCKFDSIIDFKMALAYFQARAMDFKTPFEISAIERLLEIEIIALDWPWNTKSTA